jgi:peptidoglycan hydrolase CwlO-like protein
MTDVSHQFKKIFIRTITIFLLFISVLSIFPAEVVFAQPTDAEKAILEKQLAELEAEIKEQEAILGNQKVKSASLQRDIEILRAEISKAKAKIKARDIEIKSLSGEITQKEKTIVTLNTNMEERREALGEH